jgi:hypothetical protein
MSSILKMLSYLFRNETLNETKDLLNLTKPMMFICYFINIVLIVGI